ncbi:MAG: Lipid-A-disaccharide synthase [Verrucomicrobiae bacterium]|nr:Lipid-A-disaccharide synthase [Verrucomicrobiae bacterium]
MNPVMFIAGEASGDSHAAAVIRALGGRVPVFGVGGPKMEAAGMELLFDLTEHAVVGFIEVLKNYGKFKGFFEQLLGEVGKRQPSAVVLVDFPGFNLRFAKAVKRRYPQTKVIYYISPQLWAWHASRAEQMERDVDLLLTIFPFEKAWYATRAPRLPVAFVGHPLAEQPPAAGERQAQTILLLPGSREREVAKLWPVMSRVVDLLPGEVKFVAAAVNEPMAQMMRHPRVEVEVGTAREWMQRASLAITASGTATMECAFAGCPMIVVYKVNWLTYLIGRLLIQVKWLAMPNVIAGRSIVPELIQHAARPESVAKLAGELLQDAGARAAMQGALAGVVNSLGGPGASARAAELIWEKIQ